MTSLPTPYQEYIALSRYARWIPEKNRREYWPETVDRYIEFFAKRFPEIPQKTLDKARNAIVSLDVMPSMRALMTAGKALELSELAGYNCSYLAIDSIRSFDEVLFVLMNGVGVGFSVERQYITQMPEVPDEFRKTDTCIVVADSKRGWATALKELIALLFSGQIPSWDLSKVRPAGARLKTFGGRASGPLPLDEVFKYTVSMITGAKGRKLSSIECHDLVCKIAECVVVGGVRRSALISLSNLSDERMRNAKSGQWWNDHTERSLANNSVAYTEKPDIGIFMSEWLSLYRSKSGERGIFNRKAAENLTPERREPYAYGYGTNPCCFSGDMCLLTRDGYRTFEELADYDAIDIVNANGDITTGEVWCSGEKDVVTVVFEGGSVITCTHDHVFMLADGSECKACELTGKTVSAFDKDLFPLGIYVEDVLIGGKELVYDFTEPKTSWGVVEGVIVHNSEIILRSNQLCNLTEVVIRKDDTLDTLLDKIEIATILGTLQSTLTNFKYVNRKWKENCEEERLLGVSLTGICDHPLLSTVSVDSARWLREMREYAKSVNAQWSERLGINKSASITCVKPSGTVSQLVDSASGIHPRYSPYYIRTVRADKKDPLAIMMRNAGVPCEDDVMRPDSTYVFSFPVKAPEGSVMRDDRTALEQLELWKQYQLNYCEHKPSITVYVKEHEWLAVGAWVYDNFDIVSGISFLPHSDHTYRQAPYQECTEDEYNKAVAAMPNLDWLKLGEYEKDDNTEAMQTLACTSGHCEI